MNTVDVIGTVVLAAGAPGGSVVVRKARIGMSGTTTATVETMLQWVAADEADGKSLVRVLAKAGVVVAAVGLALRGVAAVMA